MECGCAGGFEVSGGALETARGARALPGVNLVNPVRILRTPFVHASSSGGGGEGDCVGVEGVPFGA